MKARGDCVTCVSGSREPKETPINSCAALISTPSSQSPALISGQTSRHGRQRCKRWLSPFRTSSRWMMCRPAS